MRSWCTKDLVIRRRFLSNTNLKQFTLLTKYYHKNAIVGWIQICILDARVAEKKKKPDHVWTITINLWYFSSECMVSRFQYRCSVILARNHANSEHSRKISHHRPVPQMTVKDDVTTSNSSYLGVQIYRVWPNFHSVMLRRTMRTKPGPLCIKLSVNVNFSISSDCHGNIAL